VFLKRLAGPCVGALDSEQDVLLLRCDLLHGNVRHHTANDGTEKLHCESAFGCKMDVLAQLQVLEHMVGLIQGIPAKCCKVHVCKRSTREKISTDHLNKRLSFEGEAEHGGECSEEGKGHGGDTAGEEECPPRKS
jgi:hypothetical protein